MITVQQSQALSSHFESFWSIMTVWKIRIFLPLRFYVKSILVAILTVLEAQNFEFDEFLPFLEG